MGKRVLEALVLSSLVVLFVAGCGDDSKGPVADKGPGPDMMVPTPDLTVDGWPITPDGPVADQPVYYPEAGPDGPAPDVAGDAMSDATTPDGPVGDAATPTSVCSKAQTLTLTGGTASVSDEIKDTETTNDVQLPSSSCGGNETKGAERFYAVTLTAGMNYKISVAPDSGYNVALYLSTDCNDMAGSHVACADDNLSANTETIFYSPAATGTFYIGVDSRYDAGSSYSYGTFTLTVDEVVPPANDQCANAKVLSFVSGKITETGTTVGAADDAKLTASDCTGDTTDGPDVFYQVTLTGGLVYKFTLDGTDSSYDEVLYLFTDCTQVAGTCGQGMGADDYSSSAEELTFKPAATGTFYIGVDGQGAGDAGDFTLTIEEFTPPANDTCAAATAIPAFVSGKASVTGSTVAAANDVSLTSSDCTGSKTDGPDVFYKVNLDMGKTYVFTLDTSTSGYDVSLYVFTVCAQVAASCGADMGSDASSSSAEVVAFAAPTTGEYYIGVDGYAASDSGNFTLTVEEFSAPGNDTCANAELLTFSGTTITKTGITYGATDTVKLTASDCTGDVTDGPDVFYKVDLTAGTTYAIKLDGTGFDEVLYVFTDCSSIAGTCGQGMGADESSTSPEEVAVTPTSSGIHYIGVDGHNAGEQGAFTLTIAEAPANNSCANAAPLTFSGGVATASGDTSFATDTITLTSSSCTGWSSPGPDLFYSVTLTASQQYTVTLTPASTYDPLIYVFTDCTDAEGTCPTGWGDDTIGSGDVETLTITPTTTGTYYIGVDSYYSSSSSKSGTFTLEVK